jgi:hypothetical protein
MPSPIITEADKEWKWWKEQKARERKQQDEQKEAELWKRMKERRKLMNAFGI